MMNSTNFKQFYEKFIKPLEYPGLMNQISPRVFEMAGASTVMILYEGTYSGILTPNIHYLPLKKDLSNLSSILDALKNASYIDDMVQRTKEDIIDSKKYSYQAFISMVDKAISKYIVNKSNLESDISFSLCSSISSLPLRAPAPFFSGNTSKPLKAAYKISRLFWNPLPKQIKTLVKSCIGRA